MDFKILFKVLKKETNWFNRESKKFMEYEKNSKINYWTSYPQAYLSYMKLCYQDKVK